jgi:tetratricopeptide (TPR) repeat protein
LGGVGKTQIALEFAHRHAADYYLVWWMAAETTIALTTSLTALGSRLGLPEQASDERWAGAVLDRLRRLERWLLIYDNAADPAALSPYLSHDLGGHIIVTSRNPTWAGIGSLIPVEVLDRREATTFLLRRIRDAHTSEEQAAAQLAAELGDLPLALEQAAAYVESTRTSLAQYLDLLHRRQDDLLARGRPRQYEATIATTWRLALEEIAKTTPAAIDLLNLCAFLAPEVVPGDLFAAAPDVLPATLEQAVRDQLALEDTIAQLRRYSLVDRDRVGLRVHRLVQAVVRRHLTDEEEAAWIQRLIKLLQAAWPTEASYPRTWPRCSQLLPHVMVAAHHAQRKNAAIGATITLLNTAGSYLHERGQLAEARTVLDQAVALSTSLHSADDLKMTPALTNLGLVLSELGEVQAAYDAQNRALAVCESRLGPSHLDTAAILNNLGVAMRGLRNLPAAREALERALAIYEARLGPDHPSVATSLNNLGGVLYDLGELRAARDALQRAVAIRQAQLGPGHPQVASSLDNLGAVLRELGDLAAARDAYQQALTIFQTRLGPDHPNAVRARANLARVLDALGNLPSHRSSPTDRH